MACNGAGEGTTRPSGCSWEPASRKKTFTGTSDERSGKVVVVVGRWGFNSENGTLEDGIVCGAPWVGTAHPASAPHSAMSSTAGPVRRLTRRRPRARRR